MRKYVTKILCVLAVVLVFGMSFFLGVEKDITKLTTGMIAQNKLDDANPCTSGNGTEYYVNGWGVNVRASWSQYSDWKGSLNRCTKVTVYCENNGWAKISKVADLWVAGNYLQTNKPNGCKNNDVKTTATKDYTPISYNISNPKYTYAEGMDKMYSIRFRRTFKNQHVETIHTYKPILSKGSKTIACLVIPKYRSNTAEITLLPDVFSKP